SRSIRLSRGSVSWQEEGFEPGGDATPHLAQRMAFVAADVVKYQQQRPAHEPLLLVLRLAQDAPATGPAPCGDCGVLPFPFRASFPFRWCTAAAQASTRRRHLPFPSLGTAASVGAGVGAEEVVLEAVRVDGVGVGLAPRPRPGSPSLVPPRPAACVCARSTASSVITSWSSAW